LAQAKLFNDQGAIIEVRASKMADQRLSHFAIAHHALG